MGLVLREVAYLHVVPQGEAAGVVAYLAHDALHEGGLSFAVLAHEGHLLAPVDGEVHVVEHHVLAVCLADVLADDGVVAAAAAARKLQPQGGRVFFVHLHPLQLLQLLDAALHLHGLGGLVAETLDEGFGVFYLLLLVLVGAELLLAAFLAQLDKLVVLHLVVVDVPAGDFDGAGGDVVQEGAVVAHQHHGVGPRGEELLQPLDALDVEVVRRLVQQQHVGTLQQQLGQLDAHAPSAGEFARGAVEVLPREAQAHQRALQLGLVIGAAHHQEAVILVREAFDEFPVVLALVVGAVGQLLVHAFDVGLHLADVPEGLFRLLQHRAAVRQLHHLGQVADGAFAGHGHRALGRLLQARQYLEHRALARPVLSHQGDAVFLVDDVRHVLEQGRGVEFHLEVFY